MTIGGVPEPEEEFFEAEEETQEGDRDALASYERAGTPMDVDPEEPTIYQSDTESYRGMCSAEFERLMVEVENEGEADRIREDANEGNSRPTDLNFNEEEGGFEEGTGENEETVNEEKEPGAFVDERDETPKGLRRSKRISERGPAKSYATPPKRSKKVATASKGACSRTIAGEKELRRALEEEFFKTTPLDETQAEQADYYCGIRQVNIGMIAAEGSTAGNEGAGNFARDDDPNKDESVLDGTNFDTNDELSDDEVEEESASK